MANNNIKRPQFVRMPSGTAGGSNPGENAEASNNMRRTMSIQSISQVGNQMSKFNSVLKPTVQNVMAGEKEGISPKMQLKGSASNTFG